MFDAKQKIRLVWAAMRFVTRYVLVGFALASCTGFQARYYQVKGGDSWASIAQKFDVPLESLQESNDMYLTKGLKSGAKVYIPFEENPRWNLPPERSAPSHSDLEEERVVSTRKPASVSKSNFDIPLVKYVWPTRGRVSSYFGKRHGSFHEGIDIAAPAGTPIQASRSGHVIYASNKISGYGNLVIIRHADAYATVYGHLSKILVKRGQFISKGTLLGKVGMTGHATSPHLHFEVRRGQIPTNPMHFLPGEMVARNSRR